ncbi:PDR/VanB family oxidoreductase [Arenicella sp.]|nr:PDR/VanB family oxidoreductase [Arenicella sp.]
MSEQILLNVVIQNRHDDGRGVAVLRLVPTNGETLPSFSAGAHIDVHINEGLIRQYSLSNDPVNADHYRIGVLHDADSRGGSVTIFKEFQADKTIQISSPRNHFEVRKHDSRAILVAGGIGITPLLAMAYELRAQEREFVLHYCLNKRANGAFIDELEQQFGDQLVLHCSEDKKFDPVVELAKESDAGHLYICGPTGFMDWIIDTAKEQGYSSEQIHFEYFNADVEIIGDAIEVYCEESDMTVMVKPDESIANALSNAGITVNVSCEQGVCGTCITDVLEGEPDHRDHFLTDEEKADNDQMALCCSRAKSTCLVVDI